MKIAVVTDDSQTISAHFGRAQYYLIYTVENGKITGQETRTKPGHKQPSDEQHESHNEPHGTAPHSEARHSNMMDVIMDCDVVLTRGMGKGAYEGLKIRSIKPIITDIHEIQAAVEAYLSGNLIDHLELLH
jgi:predicted Fe-Mo cluster-binding NifX family protein